MQNKKRLIVGGLFTFLIVFFFISKGFISEEKQFIKVKDSYFNPTAFAVGIYKSSIENDPPINAKGIIIPHHVLPGVLISDLFNSVQHLDIKTVIIISPNHYSAGNKTFLTSCINWQSEFGLTFCDENSFNSIKNIKFFGVMSDLEVVEEHGIAGIIPYVKYYFPNSKVVPVVVSNKKPNLDEIEFVSEEISKYVDEKTLVIGAFDFSHYLTADDAQKMDEQTKDDILKRNYKNILRYTDDNTDSPVGLTLFLKIMDEIASSDSSFHIVRNTNSGYMFNQPNVKTTSYIIGWQ